MDIIVLYLTKNSGYNLLQLSATMLSSIEKLENLHTNLNVMAKFKVIVNVSPLPGVLDPAAAAVMRALPALDFNGVSNAQIGKRITFDLEANSTEDAQKEVEQMCERLLANPVIEIYDIEISEMVNA